MGFRLLFEPFFRGPSWDTWRAVLKAAAAEPMLDREKTFLNALCRRFPGHYSAKGTAVETLARSDRRIASTVEQWDADPWLLNTPGGIIDLRTGDGFCL